jgi:hypothetical protein
VRTGYRPLLAFSAILAALAAFHAARASCIWAWHTSHYPSSLTRRNSLHRGARPRQEVVDRRFRYPSP